MSGYYRHILSHNAVDWSHYLPFRVGQKTVGYVRRDQLASLAPYEGVLAQNGDTVRLSPDLTSFADRTEAMATVCAGLVAQGLLRAPMGELYGAFPAHEDTCLFAIDRRYVTFFGILGPGVHVNGIVGHGPDRRMWIGKRSMTKANFPGALDNMVAGGKPYDEDVFDLMVRECFEEAGIPEELAQTAVAVSSISYAFSTPNGLKRDICWLYDLELPHTFEPICQDGEVEAFTLMRLADVAAIVRDTDEFKFNCNLTIIDYLIRTGFITPKDPDYTRLCAGLHGW